ncbi:MAG: hypothetical protein WCZ90_00020 [Melioribacteraceae bacterium]
MISKSFGLLLFVLGLIFTLYTGFDFVTKEKVVDFGSIEITKEKNKIENWSPLYGIGAMIIGGVLFISGNKKHFRDR